jgi:hypothetical protein
VLDGYVMLIEWAASDPATVEEAEMIYAVKSRRLCGGRTGRRRAPQRARASRSSPAPVCVQALVSASPALSLDGRSRFDVDVVQVDPDGTLLHARGPVALDVAYTVAPAPASSARCVDHRASHAPR